MSTQRYISTSFWDDKWIRTLDPSERYLYLYLITNTLTNIAGVYQITIDRMAYDTGYDERTLRPMLNRFTKSKKAVYVNDEWMILPSWPKHQKWEKKATIKTGIEEILKKLPVEIINILKNIGYIYPIDTLPIPYTYHVSYLDPDPDPDSDLDLNFILNSEPENQEAPTAEAAPLPAPVVDLNLGETNLYLKVKTIFEEEQPGKRFKSYPKEGSAIKALIKDARARAPDDPEGFLMSMIIMFKRLRQTDKFFGKQPFTPSALNSAGIFDRVLTEGQREWSENREAAENYEEILF